MLLYLHCFTQYLGLYIITFHCNFLKHGCWKEGGGLPGHTPPPFQKVPIYTPHFFLPPSLIQGPVSISTTDVWLGVGPFCYGQITWEGDSTPSRTVRCAYWNRPQVLGWVPNPLHLAPSPWWSLGGSQTHYIWLPVPDGPWVAPKPIRSGSQSLMVLGWVPNPLDLAPSPWWSLGGPQTY